MTARNEDASVSRPRPISRSDRPKGVCYDRVIRVRYRVGTIENIKRKNDDIIEADTHPSPTRTNLTDRIIVLAGADRSGAAVTAATRKSREHWLFSCTADASRHVRGPPCNGFFLLYFYLYCRCFFFDDYRHEIISKPRRRPTETRSCRAKCGSPTVATFELLDRPGNVVALSVSPLNHPIVISSTTRHTPMTPLSVMMLVTTIPMSDCRENGHTRSFLSHGNVSHYELIKKYKYLKRIDPKQSNS